MILAAFETVRIGDTFMVCTSPLHWAASTGPFSGQFQYYECVLRIICYQAGVHIIPADSNSLLRLQPTK